MYVSHHPPYVFHFQCTYTSSKSLSPPSFYCQSQESGVNKLCAMLIFIAPSLSSSYLHPLSPSLSSFLLQRQKKYINSDIGFLTLCPTLLESVILCYSILLNLIRDEETGSFDMLIHTSEQVRETKEREKSADLALRRQDSFWTKKNFLGKQKINKICLLFLNVTK